MSNKKLYIDKILDNLKWEKVWEVLKPMTPYERFEDDSIDGILNVTVSPDGDCWVDIYPRKEIHSLRFRTFGGGTQSLRVNHALIILMMAIEADNKERPQNRG